MRTRQNSGSGGAQTNVNGLHFEQLVFLPRLMNGTFNNFTINLDDNSVSHYDETTRQNNNVGIFGCKHDLYRYLRTLTPPIIWSNIISKQLLPDQFLKIKDTFYILEVKYQNGKGSVDEKLQTCAFKLQEYKRLVPSGSQVKYSYILNSWFKRPEYRDVKNYIRDSGCDYFFPIDENSQQCQGEINKLLNFIFV